MTRSSLNESDNFQYTVVPAVTKVTGEGNEEGQEVEIEGSGFSRNAKNNTVEVDGNECVVTEASATKIKCQLGKRNASLTKKIETNATSQNNGYTSGSGLKYRKYSTSTYNIWTFVNAVRGGGGGTVM